MVSQLFASPQFAAFFSGLILTVLWAAVGRVGRFLEAQGAQRGIAALIVLGKQLEALGFDGDKLKGKQGAPEAPAPGLMTPEEIEAVRAVLATKIADAVKGRL